MGYSPASAIALSSFGAPTANIAMGTHKFTGLLDGTTANDSAGWDQLPGAGNQYAYVVSGCVWTADAAGSTRNASMTSGTVMIAGLLYTVAAVTAHACTASSDTYVDINIQSGVATVVYTTVTNNSLSPALASSGTMLNTVRIAIVTVGASNIAATTNIGQGQLTQPVVGATLGSSTVAAGSNGSTIVTTPLNVAAGASFSTGGGWAQVAHSTMTYTIQYTGVSSNTLTGVTLISGDAAGTVATGDTVTQVLPLGVCDMLGNLIYPTAPYPRLIGYAKFTNSITSTLTTVFPVAGLIAAFNLPGSLLRNIRITLSSPFLGSSATAGTALTAQINTGNAIGGSGIQSANEKVAVASDGSNLVITGIAASQSGASTAQLQLTQGAAGTITLGATYATTSLFVEAV